MKKVADLSRILLAPTLAFLVGCSPIPWSLDSRTTQDKEVGNSPIKFGVYEDLPGSTYLSDMVQESPESLDFSHFNESMLVPLYNRRIISISPRRCIFAVISSVPDNEKVGFISNIDKNPAYLISTSRFPLSNSQGENKTVFTFCSNTMKPSKNRAKVRITYDGEKIGFFGFEVTADTNPYFTSRYSRKI